MKTTIGVDEIVQILEAMSIDLENEKDSLTELDSAIGDGDLGITISRGFHAVQAGLQNHPNYIGQILVQAGVNFNNGAGSTMGALLGTAFIRAGKEAHEKVVLNTSDVLTMFIAAENGISEKGKAGLGDKTMLDALIPARKAIEKANENNKDLVEAIRDSVVAAEIGLQSTVQMKANFGRARWLGERSIGHKDPGATVVWLILRSILKSLDKMETNKP